jgi:lysyl endopeptidase
MVQCRSLFIYIMSHRQIHIWLLSSIFIFIIQPDIFGQSSFGGTPESFNVKIKSSPAEITMPGFSVDSLLKLDSIEVLKGRKTYRFAKAFEVDYNPLNSGEWITSDRGIKIWRLSIYSESAFSIGISFNNYHPVVSARIYIYNPEHTEIFGAFTSDNITPGGYLTVYPLPSDHAIIEYDLPEGADAKDGFRIGIVAHDYKNAFGKNSSSSLNSASSGLCNVDINCAAGSIWQNEKRAVCKLIINQSILCTGALINNVRKDGKAFLITANHCIPLANTGYNTLAIFNYEKDSCGGNKTSANQSISGMWLRATTTKIDFSLLELGEKPPYSFSPYYVGWSIDTLGISNETAIHHPQGDVKKISHSSSAPFTDDFGNGYEYNSHWRINRWNIGTTEAGSSGCPLFDQNHYIIGTLTGGLATCQDPDSDYFQKISKAWADFSAPSQQLKYWLDPDGTGTRKLAGMNLYDYTLTNCAVKTNISSSEITINPIIPAVTGAYAGHNGLAVTAYADRFIASDSLNLSGVIFNIATLAPAAFSSSLNIKIWKGSAHPDTLIYSQNILYKTLINHVKNNINLERIVGVKDTFFVGFEITYAAGDKFAMYIVPDRTAANLNTAYAFRSNSWISFPNIPEYVNLSTSLDIGLQICDTNAIRRMVAPGEILIFPNPTSGLFTIKADINEKFQSTSIFNLAGSRISFSTTNISPWEEEIDLGGASAGMYIIKVQSGQKLWTKKILKF